jgi:hypothetical protein
LQLRTRFTSACAGDRDERDARPLSPARRAGERTGEGASKAGVEDKVGVAGKGTGKVEVEVEAEVGVEVQVAVRGVVEVEVE